MNAINPIGLDVSGFQNLVHNQSISEEAKLTEATRQFEGVMIRQFLNDALKPLIESEMVKDSGTNSIYRSYLIDVMADSMSRSGEVGITTSLQAAVTRNVKSTTEEAL